MDKLGSEHRSWDGCLIMTQSTLAHLPPWYS